MELRQLRYFTTVAALGSFSRAAERLHLTQPAVSRQIKSLEEELGIPLLERGTNTASLTRAGEIFNEDALDLISRADAALRRVRGERREESLRVGYVAAVAAGILPKVLARFSTMAQRVRLELSDLRPREVISQGAAGRLDLAILPKGLEGKLPEFEWRELYQLRPVLVLPAKHTLAKRASIAPTALRDLALHGLDHAAFPEYAPRLRNLLKCFGVKPVFAAQSADCMATLFANLEATGGVAVLTEAIEDVLPAFLVTRPFSPSLPTVQVMAGISAVQPNPQAEGFVQLICEESKHQRSRLHE